MGQQTQVEKQPSTEARHKRDERRDAETQQAEPEAEVVDQDLLDVCESSRITIEGITEVLRQFKASQPQ